DAASRSAPPADIRTSPRDVPTLESLALKLALTPALIGLVSLAGRRWGPGVSGWRVGFPLTSGPIAFFLALDHGVRFAAAAAVGSMTGAGAQAAFCLLYGRLARRGRWGWAPVGGGAGAAGEGRWWPPPSGSPRPPSACRARACHWPGSCRSRSARSPARSPSRPTRQTTSPPRRCRRR